MPRFSQRSKDRLSTCHPDIQALFNEVIKYRDCSVLEGVRSLDRQRQLVLERKSTTLASKHLEQPDGFSHAVDVMPYPIDWDDKLRQVAFANFVKGVAVMMGIDIEWGGDWNTFYDGPHYQIGRKR